MIKFDRDLGEVVFRCLFCIIFLGLGAEHLFSDQLVQLLMPYWLPYKRAVSVACGLWLVGWGTLILLGWQLRRAAFALAAFLVIVTALVHLPGVFATPESIPTECAWLWTILQRSNLVKNLCLFGVCVHLLHHEPGKYSLQSYWNRKAKQSR